MSVARMSRRQSFAAIAALLAGTGTSRRARAADEKPAAEIVDTHIHLVETRVPGGSLPNPIRLAPFDKGDTDGPKKLAAAFSDEGKKVGLSHALCMPRIQLSDADPLGIAHTVELAALVKGVKVHAVGVAHPERFDRDHMDNVERELKKGAVKALKAYLGYFHHEPFSPGYRLYFKLAAKYQVPIIFHCGDTFSKAGKVKFSHPLKVDEIAVDFPKVKFVIAHVGNPWVMDAAQVAYKNDNVWIDLSGLLIGSADDFAKKEKSGVLGREVKRVLQAVEYTENSGKFLYGTDWPLAPMPTYQDFIKQLFPEKDHEAVFGGTAKKVFGL